MEIPEIDPCSLTETSTQKREASSSVSDEERSKLDFEMLFEDIDTLYCTESEHTGPNVAPPAAAAASCCTKLTTLSPPPPILPASKGQEPTLDTDNDTIMISSYRNLAWEENRRYLRSSTSRPISSIGEVQLRAIRPKIHSSVSELDLPAPDFGDSKAALEIINSLWAAKDLTRVADPFGRRYTMALMNLQRCYLEPTYTRAE